MKEILGELDKAVFMRIIQVITKRQLRGAEVFALQLSRLFVSAGHDVLIVALRHADEFQDAEGVEQLDLNIDESARFFAWDAWRRFARIVREWKPDVIQANASETLKFTVFSKTIYRWRTPIIYRNANKVSDFIKSPFTKWFNMYLVRKVAHIISVSELCRSDFARTFHVRSEKTTTIPIGTIVDLQLSAAPAPFHYWINVASLVPEKNHKGLLSIFKQYRERGGLARLWIVGDGKLRTELQQLNTSLGLSEYVRFLGYRNNVAELISNSQGLLLPSLIEGVPGVILEAMVCRTPVVAYAVGGIPEIIDSRTNGVLVLKNDEAAFVSAMIEIEEDAELRNNLVNRAFASCVETFDIQHISKRFLDKYNSVVGQHI